MKVIFTILSILLIQSSLFAQEERVSLALELNPILNLSLGGSTNKNYDDLNKIMPGIGLGLAFYYKLSEKNKLDAHIRWNTLSQRATHRYLRDKTQFMGVVTHHYHAYSIGASWHRMLREKTYASLGVDVNLMSLNSGSSAGRINDLPDGGQRPTLTINENFPYPSSLHRMFSLNAGLMQEINIGRRGKQGLIGLRFKYPLTQMPEFSHSIDIEFDGTEENHLYSYNTKVYQVDFMLAFKIFRKFETSYY